MPDIPDAGNTLPAIPPGPHLRPGAWLRRHRVSFSWFLPAFVVGLVAQIVNLAGSPQRIAEEGTPTAQAWALDTLGRFTPTAFWFDQAPLGWLQLAGYAKITSAFDRYDVVVLAGREFMVVTTMVSATLLWMLARRLRLSRPAATAALLLFTLSPLALPLHRSFSPGNVATMWLLAALVLALGRCKQLVTFAFAAAASGIAVLSDVTFLLALPLLGWLMWRNAEAPTRRRSLAAAASVLALIGAGYAVLALVGGALAPGAPPADPGTTGPEVSGLWWRLDPVGVIAAVVAAVGALVMKRLRPFGIALLLLTGLLFLPAGPAPVPSVLLLIPFGALLIPGVVFGAASSLHPRSLDTFPRQALGVLLVTGALAAGFLAGPLWTTQLRGVFLADLDRPMRDAETWVAVNVPKSSRLIVDDSMRIELVQAGFGSDDVISHDALDSDSDSAVQAQVQAQSQSPSPDGWRDSDYVVTTDSMRSSATTGDSVDRAIDSSLVVASFGRGDEQVDIRRIRPDGIDQADADARSRSAERAAAGTQLAANPGLSLEGDARDLLGGGRVDSRIILSLGQLLGDGTATVAGFPLVTGETGSVRRQVLISSSPDDGEGDGGGAGAALANWFQALGSPVAPSAVVMTPDGVLVTFSIDEPEALLPPPPPTAQ